MLKVKRTQLLYGLLRRIAIRDLKQGQREPKKQIPGVSERAFIKLLELFPNKKGRVCIEIDLNFFHVTVILKLFI